MLLVKTLYNSVRQLSTIPRAVKCQLLRDRKLVRVCGNDAGSLLQGMVTNDIGHLGAHTYPTAIYSMFLNSRGRAICDAIIYREDCQSFLIECDAPLQDSLVQHLRFYKLRKKAFIKPEDDLEVWVVHPSLESSLDTATKTIRYEAEPLKLKGPTPPEILMKVTDPRLKYLGVRLLSSKGTQVHSLLELADSTEENSYTELRHRLGVGEGNTDFLTGDAMPLESNLDLLNGVSFHKGCYIGQELTARVYHTGEVRKRIMPILLGPGEKPPEPNESIVNEDGKSVGKLRGYGTEYGLALLRIDQSLKSESLSVGQIKIRTGIPSWWPSDRH